MNKRSYKVPFIVSMIFNVMLVAMLVAAGTGMQKNSDIPEESSATLPSAEAVEYDLEAISDGEDLAPADEEVQTTSTAAVTTTTTTAAPTTTTAVPVATTAQTTTKNTTAKKTTPAPTAKPTTTTTAKPTTTTTTTTKKPTTTTTKGSGDNDGSWAEGWY